jgi:hypothetical protein
VTADRVLYDACTRSRTTIDDVYYVAISRARHEATIYTDSAAELPGAISRENIKRAALDLTRGKEVREATVGAPAQQKESGKRQMAGIES